MTTTSFLQKLADNILNPIIQLLFAAALVYFTFGVVKFIRGADDPGEREKGGKHIMWGLVGLVIMMGVYGILEIMLGTFF